MTWLLLLFSDRTVTLDTNNIVGIVLLNTISTGVVSPSPLHSSSVAHHQQDAVNTNMKEKEKPKRLRAVVLETGDTIENTQTIDTPPIQSIQPGVSTIEGSAIDNQQTVQSTRSGVIQSPHLRLRAMGVHDVLVVPIDDQPVNPIPSFHSDTTPTSQAEMDELSGSGSGSDSGSGGSIVYDDYDPLIDHGFPLDTLRPLPRANWKNNTQQMPSLKATSQTQTQAQEQAPEQGQTLEQARSHTGDALYDDYRVRTIGGGDVVVDGDDVMGSIKNVDNGSSNSGGNSSNSNSSRSSSSSSSGAKPIPVLLSYHGGTTMSHVIVTPIFWGITWAHSPGDKILGMTAFYQVPLPSPSSSSIHLCTKLPPSSSSSSSCIPIK